MTMVKITALSMRYRNLLCNKMLLAWCLLFLTLIPGYSTAAGEEIAADAVSMQAEATNRPPIARAGADRTVKIKTKVVLNGSKSRDPDGRIVKYVWRQVLGKKVVLRAKKTAKPYFRTPVVTKKTRLKFVLTVTDNKGATAKDAVIITVVPNKRPVAEAGVAQTVNETATVNLSGSGTDSDGKVVSYLWTQTAGDSVTLTGANSQTPSFVAPVVTNADDSKVLTFRLTVTDDKGAKGNDTVNVTVKAVNEDPTADAGTDQEVDENSSVTLSGGGTDPDGDTPTYSWTQTDSSGLSVTLTDADTATPDFTAPAVYADTTLTFTLTVNDGYGGTATDTVDVLVKDTLVAPSPTGKLNDTGITLCGDYAFDASPALITGHTHSNSEACSLLTDTDGDPVPPTSRAMDTGQDGYVGRDVAPATNDDADGHKGFSFTKISSSGYELPADAVSWSCIKDNVTGLIWEVKTDDDGLHDKDASYTWNDASSYVEAVNTAGWCGATTGWRMPTKEELLSIASYDRVNPAIDTAWFPNTQSAGYWSASSYDNTAAWYVDFNNGGYGKSAKTGQSHVRLVRSE